MNNSKISEEKIAKEMLKLMKKDGWARDSFYEGRNASPEKINQQRRLFDQTFESQKKFLKTMADGIPIIGSLTKVMGRNRVELEKAIRNESEAYKKSARATEEYVRKTGQNSKELDMVQKTLREVQKKSKELAQITHKREDLEKDILQKLKDANLEVRGLSAKNLTAIKGGINKVEQKIKDFEKIKKDDTKLREILHDLKELEKFQTLFKEIKDILGDQALKDLVNSNKSLSTIMGDLETKFPKSLDEVEKSIETFSDEVSDSFSGTANTLSSMIDRSFKDLERAINKLEDSVSSMGAAIAAGIGFGIKQEAGMFLTRQRLSGAPMAYSMRGEAVSMGVSETELLTSLAENRFALRRIAAAEGFSGADSYLRSDEFQQLRRTSYEMGYIGKEALDNIMMVTESMRAVGADSSAAAISDTIKFIKNTHKDLGITQEDMRSFFDNMMKEGAMRLTLSDGSGGSFATIDAIQKEIEFRGKLARVLNQDLEIQRKRVAEQKAFAYGDPAAAFRAAISGQMIASMSGMTPEQVEFVGRYAFHEYDEGPRGEEQRRLAAIANENMITSAGRMLSENVGMSGFGMRALLNTLLGMRGSNADEVVDQYMRTSGGMAGSVEDIFNSGMANTEQGVLETNNLMRASLIATEYTQGVIKSSVGAATTALLSGMATSTGLLIQAIIASRLAGGRGIFAGGVKGWLNDAKTLLGMGGKKGPITITGRAGAAPRPPLMTTVSTKSPTVPNIGRGAALLRGTGGALALGGAASLLTSGMEEGMGKSVIRSAATGAGLGMFLGAPGALVGGAIGAGVGAVGSVLSQSKQASTTKEEQFNQLFYGIRADGFQSGLTPEQQAERRKLQTELQEAHRRGDIVKVKSVATQLEALNSQEVVSSLPMVDLMRQADEFKHTRRRRGRQAAGRRGGRLAANLAFLKGDSEPMGEDELELRSRYSAAIEQFYGDGDGPLSRTGVESISALKKLEEYMKTDEYETTNEEKILEAIELRIKYLTDLQKDNNDLTKYGINQQQKHWRDMSDQDIHNHIASAFGARADAAMNTVMANTQRVHDTTSDDSD